MITNHKATAHAEAAAVPATRTAPGVYVLVAFLVIACVIVFWVAGPTYWSMEVSLRQVILMALLIAALIVADLFDIDIVRSFAKVGVSVSSALQFGVALSLGPTTGAVVVVIAALAVEIVQHREPVKLITNIANYALSTFTAGLVYVSIATPAVSPVGSLHNFGAMALAAAAFVFANTGIVATAIALSIGEYPWRIWRADLDGIAFESLTLPTLGALIPVLAGESVLALALVVIPLLGPYLAYRAYQRMHQETRETFEMIADLLDRRDVSTSEHSQRVAAAVAGIIEELGDLPLEEAEVIVAAARIHDIGKIATPDRILMKPGKLTEEERLLMEHHAAQGGDILGNLSMYRKAATIVRHHHERWDGKGYPDGLAGEAIPLGSRIIAVADTYDAMTSDRVYRQGLPPRTALCEIKRGAGTQFDPRIAAAFLRSIGIQETVTQPAPQLQPARPE